MKRSNSQDSLAPVWELWPNALKYEVETPFDAKLPHRVRSALWRLTFRERTKAKQRD